MGVEYLKSLIFILHKAIRRPNRRVLRREERKLEAKVRAEFKKQMKHVLAEMKKLLGKKAKKAYDQDIEAILDGIDDEQMIAQVINSSGKVMQYGADYRIKTNKLGKFGISFTLQHPLAKQYLQSDRLLVLSKMTRHTKETLRPILVDAVEKGQAYDVTARIIRNVSSFSPVRSQMIAVNEIGHAYEYGNHVPIKDAVAQGLTAEKQWATVNDDRVTPLCRINQDEANPENDNWINDALPFPSGDQEAPRDSNPRCRCTTLYQISE